MDSRKVGELKLISLESALKIFKKYGYSSKDNGPYLYKRNNEVGINYTYIDNKYGITSRVISFHNDMDLELFLKKYQWYKLNGKKEGVTLKLNNYEVSSPEVLYIKDNHVMSDFEILNSKNYEKIKQKNDKLSHNKRLLVEASNLMEHYYLEKKIKEKYTNNLYKKEEELKRYYYELQLLVDKYNKVDSNPKYDDSKRVFTTNTKLESELSSLIATYLNNMPDEDTIYDLISKIWNLNKSLELNKDYMYALRYNDDVDEELRHVVTKIDYMKELLDKKFKKMIKLKDIFNSIDSQSTYESLYDDNFASKFKEFIDKKYSVVNQIDEFKLCEYLNNFKTNNTYDIEKNVARCLKDDSKKEMSFEKNIEEIDKSLRKQFDKNLTDKEKYSLMLYSSIYRELFDMIGNIDGYRYLEDSDLLNILKITDSFKPIFEENYTRVKELLKLDVNKDIKDSVFKYINFNSEESFIRSIKECMIAMAGIDEDMTLKNNVKLYFGCNDFDSLGKDKFILTSTIISPYLTNNGKNYRVISADVKEGINVLYSPKVITLPNRNAYNQQIEVNDIDNPEIIIDTRDIKINKDDNLIVYSRFKSHMEHNDDYTYVDSFDMDYKINISKVIIEKRNN